MTGDIRTPGPQFRPHPEPVPDDIFPYANAAEASAAARKAYLAGTPWLWRGKPVLEISETDFKLLLAMKITGMMVRNDTPNKAAAGLSRDELDLVAAYRRLRGSSRVGALVVYWNKLNVQVMPTLPPEVISV